jgi:GTPase SAR1 family protein
MTNSYFKKSMGAIVVYDVTDENSFDSVSHWIEEFRTKAPQGAPIVLVANK